MQNRHRSKKSRESGRESKNASNAQSSGQGEVALEPEGEQSATTFMLVWIGVPLILLIGLIIVHMH